MALVHPNSSPAPVQPACVSRLRIAGFKNLADPLALDILPGLTGLVGPNGCGKSNFVDRRVTPVGQPVLRDRVALENASSWTRTSPRCPSSKARTAAAMSHDDGTKLQTGRPARPACLLVKTV